GHHFARCEILETAISCAVDVLREVDLPAQAVVDGEFVRDAESVLNVAKEPVLALRCFCRVADVARERLDLSEQERSEAKPATVRPLCGCGIERQLARTVRIAGHAQILLEAEVDTELDRVIAAYVRRIAHPLEFVLLLVKRAVAG